MEGASKPIDPTVKRAAIAYRDHELEACEGEDVWTVRLRNLEVRASYLDLALAQLLGNAPDAHRAAARLLVELSEVTDQQEAAYVHAARASAGRRGGRPRTPSIATPLLLGLRIIVFAAVVGTAFILTTWLTALR
jgi:hypothetical protein